MCAFLKKKKKKASAPALLCPSTHTTRRQLHQTCATEISVYFAFLLPSVMHMNKENNLHNLDHRRF